MGSREGEAKRLSDGSLEAAACKQTTTEDFSSSGVIKKFASILSGLILILVGAVGWILPILPGWPLVIAGLLILSRHFRWARRIVDYGRGKIEKIRGKRGTTPGEPPGDS